MEIKFISLHLQNFKSHRDLNVNFAKRTEITGENAVGKSTIPESIPWLLYQTNAFGLKFDPTPIGYDADETLVQLLLTVDGKQLLLGRSLKKGKANYYINEVPSKATEFNEIVEQLFDKDLFLSLFNPTYFFTRKWDEQREMLLKYVPAPANKEVLKHLPELQSARLGELLKKHNLLDIDKIHRENKKKKDKEYIAAQSRVKTLNEQLDNVPSVNAPVDSIKAEIAQFEREIKEIERVTDSAWDTNRKINMLQTQINSLFQERENMKKEYQFLKDEPIQDTCRVCKQPLQDESLLAAKADKQERIQQFKKQYDVVVSKRKDLEEELAQLEYIDVSEQIEKIRELESKRQPLLMALQSVDQYEQLQQQITAAKESESEILKSLNDSIFVLDSIKAFNAKSAELQAEKVQALFTTLSIRLFKQNKGDGEIKPDFEIERDGKPYRTLSLSESIRAGLELRDVLSQQSELIVPCFIDNQESITSFKQPNGQLIISRVVAGQELKIETTSE